MKLRSLFGAASAACLLLAALAAPTHAQRQPAFQEGSNLVAGDAIKYIAPGRYGLAGGLSGDANGLGLNPFSITDGGGKGLCFNTASTGGNYRAFCIGHDSSGNALLTVDSFGLTSAGLNVSLNGTTYGFPGAGTGDTIGPSGAVSGNLPSFNGTGGKILQDSGVPAAQVTRSVATLAALKALTATNGTIVRRLGFLAAGDIPAMDFKGQASACSLNTGAGDDGSQVQGAGSTCWIGKFAGWFDARQFAGSGSGADTVNRTGIQAAVEAAGVAAGCAYLPGRIGGWRVAGITGIGMNPTIGTVLVNPATNNGCLMGDGPLSAMNGSNPSTVDGSFLWVTNDTDCISERDTLTRHNNFTIQFIGCKGNAPASASSNMTAGIHVGYETGWKVTDVTVMDFVRCADFESLAAGSGGPTWPHFYCSAQTGATNPVNGYPDTGILAHGPNGQLQSFSCPDCWIYSQQQQVAQTFAGDSMGTVDFTIDLGTQLLSSATGIKVYVAGVLQDPSKYVLTDQTPSAPSHTIYLAKTSISTIAGSSTITLASASGLPGSVSTTRTGPWPVTPDVTIDAYGFPPGCYIQSISGTTVVLAKQGSTAACQAFLTLTEDAVFAEMHVSGQTGCGQVISSDPAVRATSNCGRVIKAHLNSDPGNGTQVVLAMFDPWLTAAVYFDGDPVGHTTSSASANSFTNLFVSGARRLIVDYGQGENVFDLGSPELSDKCFDIWAIEAKVSIAQVPQSVPDCPGYLGNNISSTSAGASYLTPVFVNQQSNQATSWSPRNRLLCGDLSACPWQHGTSFTGIGTTPTITADGWWGATGAGGSLTVTQGNGKITFQRPNGRTDTNVYCGFKVVRGSEAALWAGQPMAVSFEGSLGANYSALRNELTFIVAIGTTADEGALAGFNKTWTGYKELVNVAHVASDGKPRFYGVTFPNNTAEVGLRWCEKPVGTALAADSFSIAKVQVEPGYAPGVFEFHDKTVEKLRAMADYEKSPPANVSPTSSTVHGQIFRTIESNETFKPSGDVHYRVTKNCATPAAAMYATGTGHSGNMTLQGVGDAALASFNPSNEDGFSWQLASTITSKANVQLTAVWDSSCELN